MKRLVIGGIVEDRAWILPRYIASLRGILPPIGWETAYAFVAGDVETREALGAEGFENVVRAASGEHSTRRPEYSYARLAQMRNALLDLAFNTMGLDGSALLMIDSDILVEPEIALKLPDAPVVAAPVRNGESLEVMNFLWHGHDLYSRRMARARVPGYPYLGDDPFRVDLTGACVQIARAVYDLGIRYSGSDDPRSAEDVGFADACRNLGVLQYVAPGIRTEHFMDRDNPDRALLCADFLPQSGEELDD